MTYSVTDDAHTGAQSCALDNIEYDDLYRLISLDSTAEAKTITYDYTAIGNINKNDEMGTGTYTYSATQPHAVTAANGSTYSYDAAGNMTARNRYGQAGQTLTYDAQNRLVQVAIAGGSTVQFGYSAGGARLWKKTDGQITGLWIGSLYEEKDGKVLCHVYAGDRLVATFEPEGGFACLIENNRYLAALWHCGDRTLAVFFGDGRTPVTVMWAAALAGLALGLRYNRRRLRDRYGLEAYYGVRCIGGTDPWRQMVLLCLAASVFLSSNPQAVYAGTPDYDPVFYYYHPDRLGSSQLMTDRDGDVVQQYGYSPFGRENYRNNTYAFSVSNRYTGQTLDEETGLYYYGARYYDPELARFIQADSIVPEAGFSQALNRYTYCYNNPLKFIDPTGQFVWLVPMLVTAIKAGLVSAYICMGIAAITGGDIGNAFLSGFIGGFCGGLGGVVGTVAGGALSALATGGDPLQAAISAGVAVGVQICLGFSPSPSGADFLSGEYLKELALSTASGVLCGGVTTELMGGDFSEGALCGAAGAAAGYVVTALLTESYEGGGALGQGSDDPERMAVDATSNKTYSWEDCGPWAAGLNEAPATDAAGKAAMWAFDQIRVGDKAYGTGGTIDNFGPGMHKCNKFVVDAYEKGANVRLPRLGRWQFWKGKFPLQANDFADPGRKIPNFPVLKGGKLQVGDIVSYPLKGGLGHMAIYMGGGMIIQAGGKGVTVTSITYNERWRNMVVRRHAP